MIDIPKAKADAEEGLRIAEKASPEPWQKADCVSPKIVIYAVPQGPHGLGDTKTLYLGETYCDTKGQGRANLAFIVDSRTRAPEAYRNVIALAERINDLEAELARLNGMNLRLGSSFDEARDRWGAEQLRLSQLVAACELAEEKMTRKADEHYDRALEAEAEVARLAAEGDALKAELASLKLRILIKAVTGEEP